MQIRSTALSLIALGAFAALVGPLAGCHQPAPAAGAGPGGPGAPKAATQVSVSKAVQGPISDVAEVTGALAALNDVTVGVKLGGKVVAVFAREGDLVRAGQVLVQQDTTDLKNQYEQQWANLLTARTRLSQANIALADAKTNLKLTEQQTAASVKLATAGLDAARESAAVVKQGARTQERQQAAEAVEASRADRDSARADLDKSRADLKRYQALYREQAISSQQLDQAQSTADAASARYNSTVARYNSALQAQSLVQEGSRPEDIRRSQATVEQANQTLATATANRNQIQLRQADVQTALSQITAAQAGVRQAGAAVNLAQQAIRDASVRSPITGVVAERKVEPGMQVSTVKPDVMRVVSLDTIFFDAQLSESQFAEIHVGQPAEITVDALNGRKFAGQVSKIFPVASSTARSFTARVTLRNERGLLRPQMFARGRITLATHPDAVLVSRDAVLEPANGGGRIMVAVGGKALERTVRTGFANPRQTEILSGVQPGDMVITTGQSQVQSGDKIQIIGAGSGAGSSGE